VMTAESLQRDAEKHVLSFYHGDVDELRREAAAAGGAYELASSGDFLSGPEITEWWRSVGGREHGDRYTSHLYKYTMWQAIDRLISRRS